MTKITQWVKDSLLNTLKKNYYLKKSGVRLSLEQKHEWDRTVKPVERAIGKILMLHPYHPPVVKVEGAQALLLQLKEKGTSLATTAMSTGTSTDNHPKSKENSNTKTIREEMSSRGSQRPYTPNDGNSMPSSPNYSRPTTANDESMSRSQEIQQQPIDEEQEERIIELDEMSSHEKEIRYLHCFEYASSTLARLLINEASITISVFEDSDLKSSLSIAKFALKAIDNATITLEKSAVASNLPPDQFHEKMLVTAAKKLGHTSSSFFSL